MADRGGYEDATGAPRDTAGRRPDPHDADDRRPRRPGRSAIAFDPVLRDDPGLVSAAVAAVRLSVENERLQAEVRAQLDEVQASRARLVDAQDAERRRMERDLHDGAQQRLVSLRISLELLRRRMGADADPDALVELDAAAADARAAIDELRELAQGLHPGDPGRGRPPAGARVAGRALVGPDDARDATSTGRLPPAIEATVYFVVAEALTNTAKYADARTADDPGPPERRAPAHRGDRRRPGRRRLGRGTGLRGLEDRVGAVGGTMRVVSPPGGGTTISVDLPCASS